MNLQQLLGIELPIIQAPMAGVQGHALAVAVCNAGGLGSLPCATLSAQAMREELAAIRQHTNKPYNLNFFCHEQPSFDAAREAVWQQILSPYFTEYGVDTAAIPTAPGRQPFSNEAADVLEEFKPPIVSFHFGLPAPELLERVRGWGATILSSATTLDEALWLEARGVDAIIAQGLEAGGHRGHFLSGDLTAPVGTHELVQQIVRAVRVPVVAAGGIADASGVAAAIALGAAGVQIGTAYLLCPEATTSAVHRAALKSDAARTTALTNVFTGRPARGIVNRAMRELGPLCPAAPAFPLAANAITPLRAKAESLGSGDFSPLWAGENTRGCKEISAAELTRELAGAPASAGKPAQAIQHVLQTKPNIVLVGMPGSGKSTVGRLLAERLRCGFIDTDQLIESSRHRSLQDIVDTDGYETLRRIEEEILLGIDTRNHVIATGGSAVYSDDAMAHLRAIGVIVFLEADLASLEKRIHNLGMRGLARRPGQTLAELFAEREALYRNSADITIDGSNLTPAEVCARILEVLRR